MKKRLSIVLVIFLCLTPLGCSGANTDSLTHSEQENAPAMPESMSYEVDLGDKVSKATVSAEYWKAGEKVDQVSFVLDDTTEMFSIQFDVDSLDEEL